MGYDLYVLAPARLGFFVTAVSKRPWSLADRTPATRASGLHDFAVRLMRSRQSRMQRPPHPTTTFVTIASAPRAGETGNSIHRTVVTINRIIFAARACTVGQISAWRVPAKLQPPPGRHRQRG